MPGIPYLFFFLIALYAVGAVELALSMAAPGDHPLSAVPAHLKWWVGCRWGHPQPSMKPF